MVLVAILAVGTAISLRGQLAAVRLESTLDKIEALDRMTRGQAMRERRASTLRVDAEAGRIEQWRTGDVVPFRSITVDPGVAISRFRSRVGSAYGADRGISFSPLGQSITYGLQLTSVTGTQVWLFGCGLSGQIVRVSSDAEFEYLWAAATTRRANAR